MGGAPTQGRDTGARLRAGAALASVCAGVVTAHHLAGPPSAAWFGAACVGAAAALALRGRASAAALLATVFALAGAWTVLRVHEPASASLARLIPPEALLEPVPVRLRGVVASAPEPVERDTSPLHPPRPGGASWTMLLDVAAARTDVGWRPAAGRVRLFVRADAPAWGPGDGVEIMGECSPPRPQANPGAFDAPAWARMSGVIGSVHVPDAALVTPHRPEGFAARTAAAWHAAAGALGARAHRALGLGDAGDAARDVVAALVLGERGPGFDENARTFARTGTAHLFAVSGFHLTLLAGMALLVVRATGERGWVEPALVAVLVLIYLLIVPARPPVVRAGAMAIVLLAADAAGRRYDPIAVLAWIGVGVLAWRPLDAMDLGFQLSFGVTALLLWMGQLERERAVPTLIAGRPGLLAAALTRLRQLVWAGVACWLVSAPAIAVHAGVLSPVAPAAGLLALPPVVATMALGYAAAAVGAVVGPVGWLADACTAMAGATIALTRWLEGLPGAWWTLGRLSPLWGAAATLVALWFVRRPGWRDARLWGAASLVLAWGVAEARIGARTPPGVALRIDTLAVGDGTCHLVRAGSDALLWDCGSLTPSLAERELPRALRALGVTRVPVAVVTHANLDHFNMLPALGEHLGVRTLLTTERFVQAAQAHPGGGPGVAMAMLADLGVDVRTLARGDAFAHGRLTARVLWPPREAGARGVLAHNDASLVALFEAATAAGPRRLLLTGDIQAGAIAELLETDLDADVLELPHHGSVSPQAAEFVARCDPAVVLQSTGPSRARQRAWGGLRSGRQWWVTAVDGAAWAEIRTDGTVASGALRGR